MVVLRFASGKLNLFWLLLFLLVTVCAPRAATQTLQSQPAAPIPTQMPPSPSALPMAAPSPQSSATLTAVAGVQQTLQPRVWLPIVAVAGTQPALDKWALWTNGARLRGANIWQRIRVPSLDQDYLGNDYIGPPYSQADFNRLAALGANYVNLSIPGLFTERPPYQLDTQARDHLDQLLEQARQADLFVTIAFRTGPGRSDFTFYRDGAGVWYPPELLVEDVWTNQAAQDAWVDMWRYTAQRYRNHPVVVGYELMVEPNADEVALDIYNPDDFYPAYANTTYDWNRMHRPIVQAIREVDPDTPILLSGMGWGSVMWLPYLQPISDTRTVYAVHQYMPFLYTHQEPGDNRPYPGYFDVDWDNQPDHFNWNWMANYFSRLDTFQAQHPGPQAMNEFGVARWAPGASDFMRDQMNYLEQRGMNYAIWVWDSTWEPWRTWGSKAMNYLFGPDPNNYTEVPNALMNEILQAWSRNAIRPSHFRPQTP